MPKMRTNRAAAKRFRSTASGRLKRKKSMTNHFQIRKGPKRKRQLRQGTTVSPADEKRIKRVLGL
jgi:large subunit ribosomal protein L35